MNICRPKMYKRNIFDIDYNKLKEMGIKCIVFDLDNTLGMIDNKKCPRNTKKLIRELQNDFLVLICSNSFKKDEEISTPVERHEIDSITKENDKLIIKVESLDSIKNAKIIEVKSLDNNSTLRLFYELIRK